jgi:hypothetical protein
MRGAQVVNSLDELIKHARGVEAVAKQSQLIDSANEPIQVKHEIINKVSNRGRIQNKTFNPLQQPKSLKKYKWLRIPSF